MNCFIHIMLNGIIIRVLLINLKAGIFCAGFLFINQTLNPQTSGTTNPKPTNLQTPQPPKGGYKEEWGVRKLL